MFERLHYMQLTMPHGQEKAAREFYAGVLGLTEIDKPPCLPLVAAPGSALAASSCTSASRTPFGRPATATGHGRERS